MGSKLAYKILVQLIGADMEIGCALVDEAKAYRAWGRPDCSSRVLQVAEDTVADIQRRLQRLGDRESGAFRPLLPSCAMNLLRFDAKPPDSAFSFIFATTKPGILLCRACNTAFPYDFCLPTACELYLVVTFETGLQRRSAIGANSDGCVSPSSCVLSTQGFC
jgi:hypothetical protein